MKVFKKEKSVSVPLLELCVGDLFLSPSQSVCLNTDMYDNKKNLCVNIPTGIAFWLSNEVKVRRLRALNSLEVEEI